MNDLISRQQAFDALHCRFADGFEEDRWWNSTHVIATLKGLPAVPPERKMGHWICESQWSDTMGTYWNTWKCDQCNFVAAKGWEHTRDGMKPNGKFCSECGAPMDKKVIFIDITEKE